MPDEVVNTIITEQTPEDNDVKLFGGEEETQVVDKPIETEVPKVEEPKEEEEEEIEEIEDIELEPLEGYTRPTHKQIAKEFPDIFKKFPDLRDVIGREHDFTELFHTVEDARDALENTKDFQVFSERVVSGDAKTFLELVKDTGKADFGQFVNNFLPALKDIDNSLYTETTAPIVVDVLQSMFTDADRAGNENLKNAALHAAHYLFGNHKFATGEVKLQKTDKPLIDNKEKEEISRERQELFQERFTTALKDVEDDVSSKINDFIKSELPEELTEFLAESVSEKVFKEADKLLGKDPAYQANIKRLWQLAEKNKFDFASRQKIKQVAMNRYKEVIPELRRAYLAKATKGTGIRVASRKEVTGGSRGTNVRRSAKEIDWRQTSDEDLFSGNVKYR